ncbi:MAG: hypothetical protein ACR2JN_06260 [Lapillicoccus sp.]
MRLVARYLQAVGDSPCYDCWELAVERRYAATLGASAGLSAASGLLDDPAFAETAKGLEDLLLRDFVRNGSLVKRDATAAVDAPSCGSRSC